MAREDAGAWKYTYDKRSQVTAGKKWIAGYVTDGVIRGSYAYDNIGNRTSSAQADLTTTTGTTYASNALNQYTSLTRTNSSGSQPFEVNGTRTAGASILVNSSAPAYYGTNALYFAKMINHLSGNGKYESVIVTQNSVPVESGFQYVPPPSESPTYDADGNVLTDGRWTYEWDGENRLKTMTCPAQVAFGSTPAVPGTRLTMTYDGLSRRIAKKVEQQNAVTLIWTVVEYQGYLYDGWNCIMCVRLNNDATANTPPTVRGRLASYVWGPDIGSSSRQGANWQAAGGVGGLLFVSQGTYVDTSYTGTPAYDAFYADSFFPLWDRMGNITGYRKASTSTTDSALANTGAMLDYDAFGREIRSSGPAADKIPFHFSSKFTDIETGLNYYGYRYYDPVNGRWLNKDPIGERGGENLNAFYKNNLISYMDLFGLEGVEKKACPCDEKELNKLGRELAIEAAKKKLEDGKKLPKDAAPSSSGREFGGRLCCNAQTKKVKEIWAPNGDWTKLPVGDGTTVYDGKSIDVETAKPCSSLGEGWENAGTFHGHDQDAAPSPDDIRINRINPPSFIGAIDPNGENGRANRVDPWRGPPDKYGGAPIGSQVFPLNPDGSTGPGGPGMIK